MLVCQSANPSTWRYLIDSSWDPDVFKCLFIPNLNLKMMCRYMQAAWRKGRVINQNFFSMTHQSCALSCPQQCCHKISIFRCSCDPFLMQAFPNLWVHAGNSISCRKVLFVIEMKQRHNKAIIPLKLVYAFCGEDSVFTKLPNEPTKSIQFWRILPAFSVP